MSLFAFEPFEEDEEEQGEPEPVDVGPPCQYIYPAAPGRKGVKCEATEDKHLGAGPCPGKPCLSGRHHAFRA